MLRLIAFGILAAAAATIAVALLRPPASRAQQAAEYCRPPLKFAAGACVAQCPAGYEDTGRTCVFRNMSR
ncbi:hypothetical protein [Methylobacterium platani]|uniref:DUF3551 domain-containing protein n=2 Tax=Methylobacterium platani TaxID=427683 RepID=A0A179SAY5_9HYPH|nr:hypothetical protein [Methylobacterium platani]KMO20972.1 hypothetical protein SQ03_04700 [Methylobacterium platani JCM 14648]OAS23310.1 hypothetical protein A5481_16710 [Methylobacterium platani]